MQVLTVKQRNNRETWLNTAIHSLEPIFKKEGFPLHSGIRLSVGFPLGGFEKIAGQCFKREVSKDRHNEIFISPLIDDGVQVLAILIHELIHASDDCKSGHGPYFVKAMKLFELEGKPTKTIPGKLFKQRYGSLLKICGHYPHAALRPTKVKKQGTRLVKVECSDCGYVCRVTRKWIDLSGPPICPACEVQMSVIDD